MGEPAANDAARSCKTSGGATARALPDAISLIHVNRP